MGKKSESSSPSKGMVTPRQVAFIVDRYLSDNNFSETRSVFRNEASSFISKSPVQEAPRNLLSLEAMLNEYVSLKEQKVMVEQEKLRVHYLLHGMQEVMNVYNSAAAASTVAPLLPSTGSSPPGCSTYNSPALPVSTPSNAILKHGNVSSPITTGPSTRKRAGLNAVLQALPDSKKARKKLPSHKKPSNVTTNQHGALVTSKEAAQPSSVSARSTPNCKPNGALVQGSSVAKSLFNQPWLSPPTCSLGPPPRGSSGPNTPAQIASSQEEKSVSPINMPSGGNCSNNTTPQEITPTSCTVITSERVIVSPCKNLAYYTVERNQCIASSSPVKTTLTRFSKRDCVKSRLDFDGSDVTVGLDKPNTEDISTSESDKDGDLFDMDFPNLDLFGPNFSFSELLVDLDLGSEEIGFATQPNLPAPANRLSGSSPDSGDEILGSDHVMSEFSTTVTHVISEKDAVVQGPDNVTAVKSLTKCIRILSPVKSRRNSLD